MKQTPKTLLTLSALAGLSFTTAQASTVTWDDGGPGEDWTTVGNWENDGPIPVTDQDSVVLTQRNVLNYNFKVKSGESITDTGNNWLGLSNDGWGDKTVANLTLATGGEIDVGYISARGNNATLFPTFTIEHGATLTTDSINDGTRPIDYIWKAGSDSVTTWNTGDAIFGATIVTVELANYTVVGASSLTLVNYSGTLTGEFASATVTDGGTTLINGVDYTLDYTTDTNITLNLIPEPGTYALIGGMLALGSVMVRRRR